MASADLAALDEAKLADWLLTRRWFGSKARDVSHIHVLDVVTLTAPSAAPEIAAALIEARFPGGTHDVYQLLVGLRPEGFGDGVIDEVAGVTVYDAFSDPQACVAIGAMLRREASISAQHSRLDFHWPGDVEPPREDAGVRPMGAEQSNTSIVFDDALVLKAYRRLEAGDNPELELLRFLSDRDFAHIAPLGGWYEYEGELMDATLGVVQSFVAGARDGWELALDELGTDPDRFVARLRDLGAVIGEMHTALGSDATDPAFSPEEPSDEALSLLTATIDEEIERVFLELPDDEALAPIAGRGAEVRDRLQLLSAVGVKGKLIRHHGDLHLGQTMLAPDGDGETWIVLDFEGEPARPLLERRRKRSPLRDVAGMLRSFAYAASASDLQRGRPAPERWEDRARESFLDGYFGAVEPTLMPPGEAPTRTLLSVFELEKAVYELRYELNNRPDWVRIPVAGIARLLEEPIP
jgi:maltokinase